jgi:molybdenum cofactor cytidylyltransferase
MIAGLILAAGESSRMGQDKALLSYRGRTFLETILATLRRTGLSPLVVVLGHHADVIQRAVPLEGCSVVVNREYRLGQTSSLQAGLRALASSEAEGVLMHLVDHPAVAADTIRTLVGAFASSRASVIVPTLGGRRGHPVLFARPLFAELLALDPAQGANTVVRRHQETTLFVPVDDEAILADIDDPESYRRLTS